MPRIWIDAAPMLLAGHLLGGCGTKPRSCCRTATAPCSTSGCRKPAATRAAAAARQLLDARRVRAGR